MIPERNQTLNPAIQRALSELKSIIHQHYPAARFEVEHGHDHPESIHLITVVDLEDTDPVFELVLERMMEYQIEEELPIYVIPVRTPERVRMMRDEAARSPALELPASFL